MNDGNIITVDELSMLPDPIYARRPLEWYVGRLAKTGFQAISDEVEYMWVKVTGVDGPHLVGSLDNIPAHCTHLVLGDQITLSRLQIVQVEFTEQEWWDELDQLRSEADYSNPHLGKPDESLDIALCDYDRMTPRQALIRWKNWEPCDTCKTNAPAKRSG